MNTEEAFVQIATIIQGHMQDPDYDPRPALAKMSEWAADYARRGQEIMGGTGANTLAQMVSKIILTMTVSTTDEDKQGMAEAARADSFAMGNLLYTCSCIAAAVAEEVIGKTSDLSDVPVEFREWHSREENDGH